MKNISVIGSGTMGNGIAHVFAQFGYDVTLIDTSEEADTLDRLIMGTLSGRLNAEVAHEFIQKLDALVKEYADYDSDDGKPYRMIFAFFPSTTPGNQEDDH